MATDRKRILHQLKIAKGQVEGIINMVERGNYCIDVLTQLAASGKVLKRAASLIMEGRLKSCIRDTGSKGKKAYEKEIDDLIKIFRIYL
ncbi:MAG: metal-sensitive transcriptional regulator [Candidatus Margulisiibacteriota bacterium]